MNRVFEHSCTLEKKLEHFQVQLRRLIYFKCLATGKHEFLDQDLLNVQPVYSYKSCVMRFLDFRQTEIILKLFAQPFDLAVEDHHYDCQSELIELQAGM